MATPEEINSILARKEAENQALFVRNDYNKAQRRIWSEVVNLKIFDLIEVDDINTGDDIVIQVLCDAKLKDLQPGQKVICQVFFLSRILKVWMTRAVFQSTGLLDEKGDKLIPNIQRGAYTIF